MAPIRRRLVFLVLAGVVLALLGCDASGPDASRELAIQGILSASLSESGDLAVIGSIHHGANVWDLSRGERLFDWNLKPGEKTVFRAVALSGDGRRAVTAEDRSLAVWDATSGQSVGFWKASDKVLAIAIDREGRLAVIGQQNNQAVIFDLVKGAELFILPHAAEVYAVAIDAAAGVVMTGADDFSAVIWNAKTGEPLHRIAHGNQVKSVALSSDGRLAFSAAQREKGRVFDVISGDVQATIPLDYENFTSARFSADAGQLMLGTFRGNVYLFGARDGRRAGHWKAKPRSSWGPASSSAVLDVALRSGTIVAVLSDGMQQNFTLR